MKKITKTVINKLSKIDYNIEETYNINRKIQDFFHFKYINLRFKRIDSHIPLKSHNVQVRFYYPKKQIQNKLIIFFHGGGWSTGSIDSYDKFCAKLALRTKSIIASVNYRLAPEHKFPSGLTDCYEVTKVLFENAYKINVKTKDIILMGDSAGGNLSASVSLLARDRKEFEVKKQILYYPAVNNDYTLTSKFKSVQTNGKDWLLTSKRVNDYMKMYIKSKEDLKSIYLAPILAESLKNQPDTLVFTAEYDPLRDEGEYYVKRLIDDGNYARFKRYKETIHGFILYPLAKKEINDSINEIIKFSEGDK